MCVQAQGPKHAQRAAVKKFGLSEVKASSFACPLLHLLLLQREDYLTVSERPLCGPRPSLSAPRAMVREKGKRWREAGGGDG